MLRALDLMPPPEPVNEQPVVKDEEERSEESDVETKIEALEVCGFQSIATQPVH